MARRTAMATWLRPASSRDLASTARGIDVLSHHVLHFREDRDRRGRQGPAHGHGSMLNRRRAAEATGRGSSSQTGARTSRRRDGGRRSANGPDAHAGTGDGLSRLSVSARMSARHRAEEPGLRRR